jgi:hypothetical protein
MKIVKESIDFSRDSSDKLSSIGVGKIKMIANWLDEQGINNYTINNDLTIDVKGDVTFLEHLKKFPDFIQFKTVTGFFDLQGVEIESLRGCPYECNDFSCSDNQKLGSLNYGPKIINNSLYMNGLPLIDIQEKEKYIKSMKFLYRWVRV